MDYIRQSAGISGHICGSASIPSHPPLPTLPPSCYQFYFGGESSYVSHGGGGGGGFASHGDGGYTSHGGEGRGCASYGGGVGGYALRTGALLNKSDDTTLLS